MRGCVVDPTEARNIPTTREVHGRRESRFHDESGGKYCFFVAIRHHAVRPVESMDYHEEGGQLDRRKLRRGSSPPPQYLSFRVPGG
jgi:hypothetical protein